jgi:hypothetical protein
MYDEIGIGGIIRMNTDGTGREVYTRGRPQLGGA